MAIDKPGMLKAEHLKGGKDGRVKRYQSGGLTSMVSGPVAATILADQGAEVVKVEPLHGEQMRYLALPIKVRRPLFLL